jgi:hypothetical protein
MLQEPNATARGVARLMSPQGARPIAAAAETLTGAVVGTPIPGGSGAYNQVAAVQADGLNQGGQRPISTYTAVSGNTTNTQHILVDQQLMPRFMSPITSAGVECSGYPVDKSGNGGGSKVGTINS